ncbi:helix-turn-helix transcriptional regulator [Methylovulum miyakonense]|uniref:helix-turn-helix transcriptional regulator n=1 Tax=Methylovulum miyakonense TaxID=645578 RepID=UPI00038297BE|nr:hypothetical protein [Methylovulum miyakonense]
MPTKTNQQTPPHKIKPISAAIHHGQEATSPTIKPISAAVHHGQEAASPTPKPRNKVTYVPSPLPPEGVARLPSILAFLNISKTSFLNGVKEGRYPAGKLLSPRCRVWDVSDIRALVAKLGGEQ